MDNQELNLETRVTIKNLASWRVGFGRKADGIGDVRLAPNGVTRLSRGEIIAQVQSDNKLFTGVDGLGSHATIYIDDKETRVACDFESEDGSTIQSVLTKDKITELFKIRAKKKFEEEFANLVVTRAEKCAVMSMIQELGLNDYTKIRFAEEYTGYKMI